MRSSQCLFAVFVLLAACDKEPEGFEPTMSFISDTSAPARVELSAAVGEGLVRVPVRLVNAYGVAVGAGETVDLSVQGTDLSITTATVTLDAWGWAELEVASGTPQTITVSATGNSAGAPNGDPVEATIAGAAWPDLGLHRAWDIGGATDRLVPVSGGVARVLGAEIWVQPYASGAAPMRVAAFPGEIAGMAGGDIDSDGLPDLVAWSGDLAYVLRGRPGGGFGWVGVVAADYGEVSGVAFGDFDDDIAVDFALSWQEASLGGFQPFGHDGLWGFEPMHPLDLGEEPWSIAAGTLSTQGADEVLVLYDGGTSGRVRRFGLREDGWTPVGVDVYGYDLDRELPEGSTIDGVEDIDGDGLDDLIFSQPIDGDDSRALFIITFGDGVLSRTYEKQGLRHSVGDLSGDGVSDVLLVEQDETLLHMLTIDVAEEELFNRTLATATWGEAVAVASVDDDLYADALVSTDLLLSFGGGDNLEDEMGWIVRDEAQTPLYVSAVGPATALDGDGDGRPEAFVFRLTSDGLFLYQYPVLWDASAGVLSLDTADGFERISLGGGTAGLDIAVCDGIVYALGDDGRLVAADPADGLSRLASADIPGALGLACGPMDNAALAVLEMGGTISLYTSTLDRRGDIEDPSAQDIAVARPGSGAAEVVSCVEQGCSILAVDLDNDGVDEVLSVGSEAQLSGWGSTRTLPVSGLPSASDIDGDGRPDLIFTDTDTDRVAVLRGLAGGVAPAIWLHSTEDFTGAGCALDVDADGVNEALFLGESGRLTITRPSSTVVVAE